jgi:hypothetical protein
MSDFFFPWIASRLPVGHEFDIVFLVQNWLCHGSLTSILHTTEVDNEVM